MDRQGRPSTQLDGGLLPQGSMIDVRGCCRPLKRTLRCLGLDLTRFVRVFIGCQALYGLLLICLHILLLSPPFNEPRCDWIPGSGPWMELLDLQWSLRIRGNGRESWETPMLRYHSHGNFAGTVFGFIAGCFTVFVAIFADYSIRQNGRNMKSFTRLWFVFSVMQLIVFLICNLGKVSTLCDNPSHPSEHAEAGTLFPDVSAHCGILSMWFIEWTLMGAFLTSVGLWAAYSHVSYLLSDSNGMGAYQAAYSVGNGTHGFSDCE